MRLRGAASWCCGGRRQLLLSVALFTCTSAFVVFYRSIALTVRSQSVLQADAGARRHESAAAEGYPDAVLAALRARNAKLEAAAPKWSALLRRTTRALKEARAAAAAKEVELESKLRTERQLRASASAAAVGGASAASPPLTELPPLRIFVYDLPPHFNEELLALYPECSPAATPSLRADDSLDVWLHEQLLVSPLRTTDASAADLFFVPVYLACYLHHSGEDLMRAHQLVLEALAHLRSSFPYWNRTGGADHVWAFSHDVGGCAAPFEPMRHSIFIQSNADLRGQSADYAAFTQNTSLQDSQALPCFSPWKDIVVPPLLPDVSLLAGEGGVGVDAAMQAAVARVQAAVDAGAEPAAADVRLAAGRTRLATLLSANVSSGMGATYHRSIWQQWGGRFLDDPDVLVTGVQQKLVRDSAFALYSRSKFCLCLPGWATWTPRLVEALATGCIPVLFSGGFALPFSRFTNFADFSVRIPEFRAGDVKELLHRVSAERVAAMQSSIRASWRRFVFNTPPQPGDAFYALVHELHWRARSLPVTASHLRTPEDRWSRIALAQDAENSPDLSSDRRDVYDEPKRIWD